MCLRKLAFLCLGECQIGELGDTNGLSGGTGTDIGNITTANAITGAGGMLVVSNTNANVFVNQSHAVSGTTASTTLDLSGLDTFKANVSYVMVGVDAVIKGPAATCFWRGRTRSLQRPDQPRLNSMWVRILRGTV